MNAREWIDRFDLQPHPEGGYYRRTYCSDKTFYGDPATDPFPAGRPYSTAIHYLMEAGDYAAFHRIKSDEIWHFHEGGPLELYVLKDSDPLEVIRMGKGEHLQVVVPANHWFAAAPVPGTAYCLVGCTVSPGFDFRDHEMARAEELLRTFPAQADIIRRYCHP